MFNKKLKKFSYALFASLLFCSTGLYAEGSEASQIVNIVIQEQSEALIEDATPLQASFESATVGNTGKVEVTIEGSYGIVGNGEEVRNIIGGLGDSLPEGMSLSLKMDAPPGASSGSSASLSQGGNATLVSGIGNTSASGMKMTYKLTASSEAAKKNPEVLSTITLSVFTP